MQKLENEGNFRVRCMKYSLYKATSGSVAVNMSFEILEAYGDDDGFWNDWRGEEVEVEGAFWIIKKDGSINERQVESLVAHCGWSGDLGEISQGKWKPEDCQVVVKKQMYNNQAQFKASFINGYDSVPGEGFSMSAEDANAVAEAYGAGFRAAAANAKAKKAPAGRPQSPAKKTAPAGGPGVGEPPWNAEEASTAAT